MAMVVSALALFLLWRYRENFAGIMRAVPHAPIRAPNLSRRPAPFIPESTAMNASAPRQHGAPAVLRLPDETHVSRVHLLTANRARPGLLSACNRVEPA